MTSSRSEPGVWKRSTRARPCPRNGCTRHTSAGASQRIHARSACRSDGCESRNHRPDGRFRAGCHLVLNATRRTAGGSCGIRNRRRAGIRRAGPATQAAARRSSKGSVSWPEIWVFPLAGQCADGCLDVAAELLGPGHHLHLLPLLGGVAEILFG